MTCIVALEKNNRVYMGGDSMAAAGWDMGVISFQKVFINGQFLIGYTTSFRMGQLLEHELTVTHQEDESDMHYMVTKFIHAVQNLFKDFGFSKIENNQETGGLFLVGYRGKIYKVDDDYQVLRYRKGYDAVGAGYAYALGSLYANSTEDPRQKILDALEAAATFSNGVCKPFYVLEK